MTIFSRYYTFSNTPVQSFSFLTKYFLLGICNFNCVIMYTTLKYFADELFTGANILQIHLEVVKLRICSILKNSNIFYRVLIFMTGNMSSPGIKLAETHRKVILLITLSIFYKRK